MARVIISQTLKLEVLRKFKGESVDIFRQMKELEAHPLKGKALAHVAEIVIKEIKYKSFRFYFITDGQVLKFGTDDELASLLIKFIKMSDKKNQQQAIDAVKNALENFGFDHL